MLKGARDERKGASLIIGFKGLQIGLNFWIEFEGLWSHKRPWGRLREGGGG